jgi:hypothetical protein
LIILVENATYGTAFTEVFLLRQRLSP